MSIVITAKTDRRYLMSPTPYWRYDSTPKCLVYPWPLDKTRRNLLKRRRVETVPVANKRLEINATAAEEGGTLYNLHQKDLQV